MNRDADPTDWLRAVERGDHDAFSQLWEWCFPKLLRLAKQRLNPAKCRAYDEEDVSLSAMDSFFGHAKAGRTADIYSRDELWRVLVSKLMRKIIDRRRKDAADKRGGDAVRGDSAFFENGLSGFHTVPDENPGPEFTVELVDEADALLRQLDEPLRTIAVMKMNGQSTLEIALECGVNTRTVERRLAELRAQFAPT